MNGYPVWKHLFVASLGALIAISLSLGGWALSKAVSHEERIITIEESRFTKAQGEALRAEDSEIWLELEKKVNKKEAPPPLYQNYVNARLDAIQAQVMENKTLIREVLTELHAHTNQHK